MRQVTAKPPKMLMLANRIAAADSAVTTVLPWPISSRAPTTMIPEMALVTDNRDHLAVQAPGHFIVLCGKSLKVVWVGAQGAGTARWSGRAPCLLQGLVSRQV